MSEEKFNYFVSYATARGDIRNAEILTTEILSIDSIRGIEEEIKKDVLSEVQIINYRMF